MTRAMLLKQAENHPEYEHYLKTWDDRQMQKTDDMQAFGVMVAEEAK